VAIEAYRQYIQQLLSERAQRVGMRDGVEMQTLFDTQHDHYQLTYVGWRGDQREFGCVLHLDIKEGKIWIQHDGTEVGIANQLVELGVPKEDIVLAFHAPFMRQFTSFAVG
jgi:XisI protein